MTPETPGVFKVYERTGAVREFRPTLAETPQAGARNLRRALLLGLQGFALRHYEEIEALYQCLAGGGTVFGLWYGPDAYPHEPLFVTLNETHVQRRLALLARPA